MTPTAPAPPTRRPAPRSWALLVLVLVVGIAAILGAVVVSSDGATRSEGVSLSTTVLRHHGTDGGAPSTATGTWADGVVDEHDGVLPDGVTVDDDRYPGLANLDPDLLEALRSAATDAAGDGVTFFVHSAWRSPEYQEQLFRDAVAEHGSEEEAARWAALPERSLHVTGDAVDIGGDRAREWLSDHGSGHGLCRIYDNEPWHFELRPEAVDDGCPPRYADPTEDPRLQP